MLALGNHFAINTYSYTQDMTAADCLAQLADQGVRAVEIMVYPGHVWITDSAERLRQLAEVIATQRFEVLTLNTPNVDMNIAAAATEMRAASVGLNRAFLRLAGELGAKGLIIGPGKPNPLFPLSTEVLEGYFFSALDELVPLADQCGVRLVVENMPFAFLPRAGQVMDSLTRYGHDGIGICYDVANGHFIGEDPAAGLRTVGARLALVHVSDTTRSEYRHDAVGEGDLDFESLPTALAEVGYNDPVVVEVISRDADRDIARSVAALRALGL